MAKKTTKTTAEKPAQDMEQKDIQQEQTATETEQTGQEQEQTATEAERDDEDQETAQDGGSKEPERDEFADIPNPCVYCGPSVRGVARQYTTYQGGIPNELKELIKAHPALRRLIVPTGKFASTRKRLETPGTAEAVVYKRVKSELQ